MQKQKDCRQNAGNCIWFWVGGELLGAFVAVMIFGPDNLFSCFLIAIACAGSAYLLIKNYLNKLPDVISDDDLNNFGR